MEPKLQKEYDQFKYRVKLCIQGRMYNIDSPFLDLENSIDANPLLSKTAIDEILVEAMKEKVGKPKALKDFKDLKVLKNNVPAAPSSTVSIVRQRTLSFNRTLDLRGMRVDEALERLIAYMDDALMVGAGEVTILHGTGTGALKQLTRDYLNDLNRQRRKRGQVALDFGDGDVNHGGAGFTIIQL